MSSSHAEHWLELKVPPLAVFILALAGVWLSDQLFPMSGLFGSSKTVLSFSLFVLGVLSGMVGVVSFKLAKTTVHPMKIEKASTLVSSGIYRLTRNPMYLGMLLIIVGFIVRLENPFSLVWAVLFMLYMNRFQIVPEERALIRLFGDSYAQYQARVGRWL